MKNVMIITDTAPLDKSGGGTNGNMHCRMINSIEGFNTYTVYVTDKPINITDHVIRLKAASKVEKIESIIWGYPPYLSVKNITKILGFIRKNEISIIYIDNSISGRLIKEIKQKIPSVKVISFFHDIEIVKMRKDKDVSVLRKIILPVFYKNEKLTVQYADKTIVLNERDKRLFQKVYDKIPDYTVPISIPEINGIPYEKMHKNDEKIKALFVGVEYGPNLSGIRWLIDNVLPNITCNFELYIVGYRMEKYREEFETHSSNVHVIGTVDSLNKWYFDADVILAPIFEGGGMKVKTAEALSYGKYFIGCSESLEGYWENMPDDLRDKKIFRCDDPLKFAAVIDNLGSSSFKCCDQEIKKWADKNYSYEANFRKYKEIFASV